MFARAYRRLPLGGKLSRKRLMRGDKSALTKAIHSPYAPHPPNKREAALFQRFAPPDTPKTSLCGNRRSKKREKFCRSKRRLPCREVFGGLGGARAVKSAASHPIGERDAFGYNALHECRDSACRRPFGVRLRGNGWFRRSPLHCCAAPLRMTQRVWRIV